MRAGRSISAWATPIVLALAIAGSLAGARVHARTRATLDTTGPTFVVFLLGVILIVDRLIVREHVVAGAYYPAICVDHTTRLVDGVPCVVRVEIGV